MVKVVGANATHEEFVNEFLLDFDRIVDLIEEDGLVAHDNAGVGETPEGVADFGREFVRVVGVDGNEKRVELLQHGTKFRGNPLGKEDGDAGSDANELDVRDGVQAGDEVFELGIRQQKGVATGEEDVADLGGVFEIFDGPVPLGFELLI